jgi:5,10-methenyltetrahydromethanopterin hydrogenase
VDDGCTVLAERNGITEVISPDGVVTVGTYDEATLSPDGHSIVTVGDGMTELVTIDEMVLGEPIDLTDVVGTNSLFAFVPD